MEAKLQELLDMPLSEVSTITTCSHEDVVAFIERHAEEYFKHTEDEISPLKFLSSHLVLKYAEIKAKHPNSSWAYRFIALRAKGGSIIGFALDSAAFDGDDRVYGDTHGLMLSADEKFTLLMVPYFASGFAEQYANSLAQEQSTSLKQ